MLLTKETLGRMNGRVVGSKTTYRNGCFSTENYYLRGHSESMGRLHDGEQGPETIVTLVSIKPTVVFDVQDLKPQEVSLEQ